MSAEEDDEIAAGMRALAREYRRYLALGYAELVGSSSAEVENPGHMKTWTDRASIIALGAEYEVASFTRWCVGAEEQRPQGALADFLEYAVTVGHEIESLYVDVLGEERGRRIYWRNWGHQWGGLSPELFGQACPPEKVPAPPPPFLPALEDSKARPKQCRALEDEPPAPAADGCRRLPWSLPQTLLDDPPPDQVYPNPEDEALQAQTGLDLTELLRLASRAAGMRGTIRQELAERYRELLGAEPPMDASGAELLAALEAAESPEREAALAEVAAWCEGELDEPPTGPWAAHYLGLARLGDRVELAFAEWAGEESAEALRELSFERREVATRGCAGP